jgi:hypothetical protein
MSPSVNTFLKPLSAEILENRTELVWLDGLMCRNVTRLKQKAATRWKARQLIEICGVTF